MPTWLAGCSPPKARCWWRENTWQDQNWGSCRCDEHCDNPGTNALDVILMAARLRLAAMFGLLFASLSTMVQVGFVMGVGLLLDTFLVRTLTVPALAVLAGKGNWWPSKWRPSKQRERARVDRDATGRVTAAAASKKATAAHPSDQVTPARASDQGSAADPSDQRAMAGRSRQLAAAGAGPTAWVWTSSSAQNWLRRRSALDGS
jgi:putative drug exporter of the RND superfamily